MLRRLVLAPVLAVAALSAVAAPAQAGRLCVATVGNDDDPRLPGGIVVPHQVCMVVPIELPPGS